MNYLDLPQTYLDDRCAAARPGERIDLMIDSDTGLSNLATATNKYRWIDGCLFRLFSWCEYEICNAPARSPKGEWMAVRGFWKQYKKKAAA